jgi:serine protease AprX
MFVLSAARFLLAALAPLSLMLQTSGVAAQYPNRSGKADGRLAGILRQPAAKRPPAGWTSVIVQVRDMRSAEHDARFRALHPDIYRHLPLIHALALRAPTRSLPRLESLPFVTHLSMDSPVRKSDEFTVGSSEAGIAAQQYGLSGAGVTIAVVDSGIGAHPDLNGAVLASVDLTGDNTTADLCGHGTHVAGIIAGSGASSSGPTCFRTFYGIAQRANLVSVRVLHAGGDSDVSTVINGIQWVVSNAPRYHIRVMNLSLGHPVLESYITDPLCQAVEQAWKAGIFVVCAAGNSGRLYNQANPLIPTELPALDSSNLPGVNEGYLTNYGSIESPGNDPYVITVGAMKSHDGIRADDRIATYSSRSPAIIDQVLKPDIVAPGNQVISLLAPGSYLDNLLGSTDEITPKAYMTGAAPGAPVEYFTLSGTSMATPVVAGTAALLLQANPNLTPDTLKARLMVSADKWTFALGLGDALTFGAGYINVPAALQCTVTAKQWALSPGLSQNLLTGLVLVDANHAIWGNGGIWGSSALTSLTAIYGTHAIWGNGTLSTSSAIFGNHAIWGNTGPGDTATSEVDMSAMFMHELH